MRSATAGLVVHLVVAVVLGGVFGVLLRRRGTEPAQVVFWGLVYGTFQWYLEALTVRPLLQGASIGWGIDAARAALPALLGDLLYGMITAVVFVLLQEPPTMAESKRRIAGWSAVLLRGVVSGAAAAGLLTVALGESFTSIASGGGGVLILGAATGLGYVLLHPGGPAGTGPAAARGAGLGFMVWVVLPVTLTPVLSGRELPWSADQIRGLFPALPGCLLLGVLAAVLATWLSGLRRTLFADPAERADEDSLAVRTTRALVRGAVGGVAGGLLFTVIMAQIGYFDTVAQLVGSASTGVGVVVHLLISVVLGASYGLFFRGQSDELAAGIGWGISWGFLWWILGALTILPVWLGGSPQWTAAAAAAAFPSLIGHLCYGSALGAILYTLEANDHPWWIRPDAPLSVGERLSRRRTELAGSAPPVWAAIALVTVTLTVVLAP
ncbi:hypothetical protein [Paractinoplanes hotanensis]|uniref:Uncharacterized protein n=1 Tax=Paractinoplanes hotanensis TaxID=2906497 RepID=A0ABT0Y522_9ACTN|nr:hypothetical protein [Actinoplanes hotanensis]MCM4081134.1 hypothetical protein [Actinoplanes hotanensis]